MQSSGRRISTAQSEELERYIGVQHNFPDPYHIYLHVNDISTDEGKVSPIVRFIIYSMGKKKVILAGTYRNYTQNLSLQFNISHGE